MMTAAGVLLLLAQEPAFEKEVRPLLENFCVSCHGPERPKGGLDLARFKDAAAVAREPHTWEKLYRKVREREMPPGDKKQPSVDERARLVAWARRALDSIDYEKLPKDPGRSLIHRLSRLEYNNTVRDLLGVETRPADAFPADGSGGAGFDNNADTLFIPPILMEKLLQAAREVLDKADPRRLFSGRSGRDGARVVLEGFLPRAYRRPAEPGEVDRLLALYDRAAKGGAKFEDAVKTALRAVLVSPKFLFRIEADRPGPEPYPIGEYELASRLSYFLWASMPDDELFRLAAEKKLHDPKVLEAQVRRMIRDPKSRAFADSFTGQWLGVHKLLTVAQPDPRRFPGYSAALRDAMVAEPVEFFHTLLREDGSLLDLLRGETTFVNEELAKHYGIAGVTGPEMRRVKLPDGRRGGVVAMAGVLTLTSYPQRTSPVLRGKWVLEEVLGAPPPPPPPGAGGLPVDDGSRGGLTFRQRLEEHRKKPACASCHARMDPLGFALENFDAIGRWRAEIAGKPLDATGELPTGEKFSGPVELKKVLVDRKDEFLRFFVEKMLSYALGRGVEPCDLPAVRKIVQAVAAADHKAVTLLVEIAKSYPFRYRRTAPAQGSVK